MMGHNVCMHSVCMVWADSRITGYVEEFKRFLVLLQVMVEPEEGEGKGGREGRGREGGDIEGGREGRGETEHVEV